MLPDDLGFSEERQSVKSLYIVLAIMLLPTLLLVGCDGDGALPYGNPIDDGIMPEDPVSPPTPPPGQDPTPPPPPVDQPPPNDQILMPPAPPILQGIDN